MSHSSRRGKQPEALKSSMPMRAEEILLTGSAAGKSMLVPRKTSRTNFMMKSVLKHQNQQIYKERMNNHFMHGR